MCERNGCKIVNESEDCFDAERTSIYTWSNIKNKEEYKWTDPVETGLNWYWQLAMNAEVNADWELTSWQLAMNICD